MTVDNDIGAIGRDGEDDKGVELHGEDAWFVWFIFCYKRE